MLDFHSLGFLPAWSAEPEPEFPGDGDWRCSVFAYDRDGRLTQDFDSRWGTPVVVAVELSSGDRWVGLFPSGGLGGVSGVFACPNPIDLCVVADGNAYLVNVTAPDRGAVTVQDQVGQVLRVIDLDLILLVRFIDMVAVGPTGVAWRTPRLAVDDLRVVDYSSAFTLSRLE